MYEGADKESHIFHKNFCEFFNVNNLLITAFSESHILLSKEFFNYFKCTTQQSLASPTPSLKLTAYRI